MKISQNEARRLKRRVKELEELEDERRRSWRISWPGGVHFGTINLCNDLRLLGRLEGARMTGHAVVLTSSNNGGHMEVYACPLAKEANFRRRS